jgi:hypothetical protein
VTKPFSAALMGFVCCALFFLPSDALAQGNTQTNPTAPAVVRDPAALALASKALQAIAGTTALSDITLQANATYIAGSDQEAGPATLVALGNQLSLVTLSLTNGQRQEIRNGALGAWVGADGTAHAAAGHNCLVDASWFYPALTLAALATDPSLSVALVGQEVHNGESTYHLSFYRVVASSDSFMAAQVRRVSTMDLYLDSATLLPAALDFNLHPDRSASIDIPFEIRYGNYQSFSGVQVPSTITQYAQNSLALNLTVAKAAINSGVPASLFTLPVALAGGTQ